MIGRYYIIFQDVCYTQFSTSSNSADACHTSSSGALHCDNYQDNQCYSNGDISETGPVCCSGFESCKLATSITAAVINASDPALDGIAFRADAYYSADDISGDIITTNGGNVFLSAYYTNIDSSTTYRTDFVGNGEGNFYSTSFYGLRYYKDVDNYNNVYCGFYSCHSYNTFSNIANNIYAMSSRSLYYDTVSNVGGSIYCDGRYSCYYLTASNVAGDILGVGYQVLGYSTQTNVAGTLLAYGTYALQRSSLTNVVNVSFCYFVPILHLFSL